jgi:CspA family cold shock protein
MVVEQTRRKRQRSLPLANRRWPFRRWFNGQKGFGFIAPEDGGNDVFVHISAVERAGIAYLNEGQKLSYELKADPRRGKSNAENLKLAFS